jgi:hypothetical protein
MPSIVGIVSITNTSVTVKMNDGANGGSPINSRRIGYGLNSSAPTTYVAAGLTQPITGLLQGKKYYFWAQTHNVIGWSALSSRKEATTATVPGAPSVTMVSNITQVFADVTAKAGVDNGSPITKIEINGYVSENNPIWNYTITYDNTKPNTIGPFRAGYPAYVRARAYNLYGYGPWSTPVKFQTVAGMRYRAEVLLPNDPWLKVVPYIYQNENWVLARPYVYNKGVWHPTD